MLYIRKSLVLLTTIMFGSIFVFAQNRVDSLLKKTENNPFINKLYSDAKNSVKKNPTDSIDENALLTSKSEKAFYKYENKVIRHIQVFTYGVDQNNIDTNHFIGYISHFIKTKLQTDTKEKIIRQNLFIRENTPLQSSKLADNERYLRTLDFIQDARIFITASNADSVDIFVVTKDLFSIKAVFEAGGLQSLFSRFSDANFLGLAQKIQTSFLWDQVRNPNLGFELLYSKTNIGGSFVNGTIAYTQVNTGRSEGTENEFAYYLKLDRPMVSPFSHFAGSFEMSHNYSMNVYKKIESDFLKYNYSFTDGWIGYNLGTSRTKENDYSENRNRFFLAARYYQIYFNELPTKIGNNYDPIYNSKKMLLFQFTSFRHDFFKQRYIYGFGAIEDVPRGYNLSLTSGLSKQLDLVRPYFGFQIQRYSVTKNGAFINTALKAGSYYSTGTFSDASLLATFNYYTPISIHYKWKYRQQYTVSFTNLYNRITYEPLRIDNVYGLNEFNTDSVIGNTRISVYGESVFYNNKKVLGFHYAYFAGAGITLMKPEHINFENSDGFLGLTCGLRLRNDNLVFGTIELHGIYFPRSVFGIGNYFLTLQTDLRYRYKTNFVQAPDIVQLNKESY